MFLTSFFNKALLTAGVAAVIASATLPGIAQAGEVQNRLSRQQARINQGVKSGQLTQGEYNRDERHLDAIRAKRNADLAKNGGHLTPAEQRRLNGRLNTSSNRIYYTKHNLKTQPGA
jgi:hypothetical protein